MLYGFLVFIFVLIALMLIGIILLQSSKSGGMGTAMGGAAVTAAFGGQGADKILTKITAGLAVSFMLLALIINWIGVPGTGNVTNESIISQKADSDAVANPPNIDIIPLEESTTTGEDSE
jgi:preprotein translocase subunit SecG